MLSYGHFLLTFWLLFKTCLFFWKDSITCVWFTMSILVCFRHFGTSVFVKQLQAELIVIFNVVFTSLALCSGSLSISGFWWVFHTMTFYVYFYSSTCSAMFTFIFLLAVPRNTLFSGFFTAVSITSYLLAWPLRFHTFLLFTSIGYLVCLLRTLYYSCTGLFPINLEQYLELSSFFQALCLSV